MLWDLTVWSVVKVWPRWFTWMTGRIMRITTHTWQESYPGHRASGVLWCTLHRAPLPQAMLPDSPAQSPPRGLSASSSVGDTGILVGSHGHFCSLQTQSPVKKTRSISQVSMGSPKHLKHSQMTSRTASRVSVVGAETTFPHIFNFVCYSLWASRLPWSGLGKNLWADKSLLTSQKMIFKTPFPSSFFSLLKLVSQLSGITALMNFAIFVYFLNNHLFIISLESTWNWHTVLNFILNN